MTEKIATVNLENYTQRNYHTKMSKTDIFRQKKMKKVYTSRTSLKKLSKDILYEKG